MAETRAEYVKREGCERGCIAMQRYGSCLTCDDVWGAAYDKLPKPLPKPTILDQAKEVVYGERQASYGHPYDNHSRSGRIIGALLDGWLRKQPGFENIPVVPDIPPRIVCHIMVGTKLSRDVNRPKEDNLVDVAGYAQNAQMCEDRAAERQPPGAA